MDDLFDKIQDIRRVSLNPGDILLVSAPSVATYDELDALADQVRAKIPADVQILVVAGDVQAAVLTPGGTA